VRCAAARNPVCPPAALHTLQLDPEELVLRSLARNPACPPEILGQLLNNQSPWVCQTALDNPNLSRAAWAMWQLAHDST
jgi:hypothetical protein